MKSFTEYLKEYPEYKESGGIILDESIGRTPDDDGKCLRFDRFVKQKLKCE